MRVRLYPPYSLLAGFKETELVLPAGSTVRDLLRSLGERYPQLQTHLRSGGKDSEAPGYVGVFVNGDLAGAGTVLPADGLVELVPALAGGAQ